MASWDNPKFSIRKRLGMRVGVGASHDLTAVVVREDDGDVTVYGNPNVHAYIVEKGAIPLGLGKTYEVQRQVVQFRPWRDLNESMLQRNPKSRGKGSWFGVKGAIAFVGFGA